LAAAAGVVLALALALAAGRSLLHQNVVLAMEKAVQGLSSYRGTLEMVTENADGEKWMVRKTEIWTEGEKYALRQNDGTLTVNNGEQKWQVREEDRVIAILPLVPDGAGQGFDLRDEAGRAKQYPHTIDGKEEIAGRETIRLKIEIPGGEPYYLWVDEETNLPLQLQTAVQNALQTTYTFVEFKPDAAIDPGIFRLTVPEGYRVVEENPGQLVDTLREAVQLSGFTPVVPQQAPERIFAFSQRIVFDYGDTTISEVPEQGSWEPAGHGALGETGGNPVEVIGERLRWRQQGLEILIEGPRAVELARQIASDLILPDKNQDLSSQASVKVPVDLEIVRADQKQADAGHSPWQLDPLSVALTFVNLQVTPGGIVGEPQVPYTAFTMEKNTGAECIVVVSAGPIEKVYLQRPVRQDESGIWAVSGYDPR
jgi:outer membrane lipoprotein-sorting protein